MFNDSQVSLLINNMPEKDTNLYGILIDVLAKLITNINDHYLGVLHRRQLVEARFSLDIIVDEVEKGIAEVNAQRGNIVHGLISDISVSFHEYDFNDEQEKFLVTRIEETVKAQQKGDSRFISVSKNINKLKDLIEVKESVPLPDLTPTDDVELF